MQTVRATTEICGAQYWGTALSRASATFISYDVEPFLPTLFTHGTHSTSAYPPTRAVALFPVNIDYVWGLPADDALMRDAATHSAAQLTRVAVAEGQDIVDAPLYGNYAIAGTRAERIFGDSLPRMRATKRRYDPENVMGLAGGWKV